MEQAMTDEELIERLRLLPPHAVFSAQVTMHDAADRLAAQIAAASALHYDEDGFCHECSSDDSGLAWPCATASALGSRGLDDKSPSQTSGEGPHSLGSTGTETADER